MFKKVVTVIATVFASSVILSSAALATSNDNLHNTNGKTENNQQDKQKGSSNDQYTDQTSGKNTGKDKGQTKAQENQLKSIDKRLNKIEEMVVSYQIKFGKMAKDDDELIVEEKPVTQTGDPKGPEDTDNVSGNLLPQAVDATTESEATNDGVETKPLVEEELNEAEERAEDIAEEMEDAVKEHTGYIGKFKSLENQLNSVKKQLDVLAIKGVDSALITERADRITAIQEKITAATVNIGQIQEKIIDKIKKDHDVEERDAVEEKTLNKAWNIQFSKKLDEKTLSELVIIVHDEEGNLVETKTVYTESKKTVTVTPLQSYKVGSTYTLFIGKELSSADGEGLKRSVKMNFTIK